MEGRHVGVLELPPDREARGDAGDLDTEGRDQFCEIQGRCIALDVGAGGDDHFFDFVALQASKQFRDLGVVELKGKSEPVKLFALTRTRQIDFTNQ